MSWQAILWMSNVKENACRIAKTMPDKWPTELYNLRTFDMWAKYLDQDDIIIKTKQFLNYFIIWGTQEGVFGYTDEWINLDDFLSAYLIRYYPSDMFCGDKDNNILVEYATRITNDFDLMVSAFQKEQHDGDLHSEGISLAEQIAILSTTSNCIVESEAFKKSIGNFVPNLREYQKKFSEWSATDAKCILKVLERRLFETQTIMWARAGEKEIDFTDPVIREKNKEHSDTRLEINRTPEGAAILVKFDGEIRQIKDIRIQVHVFLRRLKNDQEALVENNRHATRARDKGQNLSKYKSNEITLKNDIDELNKQIRQHRSVILELVKKLKPKVRSSYCR
jgi:hypothetical protein